MNFFKYPLFLSLLSIAFCHENLESDLNLIPRPLIIQFPNQFENLTEDIKLHCTSWRIAAEANNLSPWKTIPNECFQYVKEYMLGRAYNFDLEMVSKEAGRFAMSLELKGDGMDAWIFDIDETLLSNLPYYSEHGYGSEIFDNAKFDKWILDGVAPVLEPSLKLYNEVLRLGFKVFLLTGRTENKRNATITNLINAGFRNWDKLILRSVEDHGKPATVFKSEKRKEMIEEGFRILGNSGDQWSDLFGSYMSTRSFKLSNPMYYIP